MLDLKENRIIEFVAQHPGYSSKQIFDELNLPISYATTKRILSKLVNENLLEINGQGKGTKYSLSKAFQIFQPINIEEYYKQEIDDRKINDSFNLILIKEILNNVDLFTATELLKLNQLQYTYTKNSAQLSNTEYNKELERLAIDLSWKSSQNRRK